MFFYVNPFGFNREYYRIIDFDLWRESDMEEGMVYVKVRVSKNAKYQMKK